MLADQYVDESMSAEARDEWVSHYFTNTLEEDATAVQLQQAGFESGAITHGRLLPVSENAITFFENWIQSRIDRLKPTSR